MNSLNSSKRFVVFAMFLLALVALAAPAFAQTSDGKSQATINPKMSLRIAVDRNEYLQLEPVVLTCNFTNETDAPLTTIIPNFASNGIVIVKSDEDSESSNQLSSLRTGFGPRFPVTFQSTKGVEEELTFDTRLDEVFPRAGTYVIRLAVPRSDGSSLSRTLSRSPLPNPREKTERHSTSY